MLMKANLESFTSTNLKFNVAQLLREEIGARRHHTFQQEQLCLDQTLTLRELSGTVLFTRTASGVFAQVQASGLVQLVCVRSLEEFDQRVTIAVSDEFHSIIDVISAEALPRPAEEDPFLLDIFHMADIGEYIREYTLLELPLKPVCETCRHHPFPPYRSDDGDEEHPEGAAHTPPTDSDAGEGIPAVVDARLEVLKHWRKV